MANTFRAIRAGVSVLVLVAAAATVLIAPTPAGAQVACTITWDGELGTNWHSLVANGPGVEDDITNWSPNRIPTLADSACLPTGSVTVVPNNTYTTVGRFTVSAGASLSVDSTGSPTTLQTDQNSTNAGTINLNGPASLVHSDGDNTDAEGLLNTGTVNFTAGGPTGFRSLLGDLTNQGTVNVDHPEATIQREGSGGGPSTVTLTNQGTIDISAGNALRVVTATVNHGSGSVITGNGQVNAASVRFNVSGNAEITGTTDVNLGNGTILAGTAGAATGNIDFANSAFTAKLEGTVPAGLTVDVGAGVDLLFENADVTNAGRINLTGGGANLHVVPNGPTPTNELINAPGGTIEITSGGSTGFRGMFGAVVNQGTVLVNHPEGDVRNVEFSSARPFVNQGTLTVSTGNLLRVCCGPNGPVLVNGAGGVINGGGGVTLATNRLEITANSHIAAATTVTLVQGTGLTFNAVAGATGGVDVDGFNVVASTLSGNIPSGFTIDLVRGGMLRSLTSFTNAGQVNLTAGSRLAAEDGTDATTETVTNTGQLVATGSTGVTTLSGNLVNQGQLTVSHPDTRITRVFESRNPTFTNTATGTVTVNAGAVLQSAAGTADDFVNGGTVNIAGRLSPVDTYRQTAGTTTLTAAGPNHTLSFQVPGTVEIDGGTLRGTGVINGGNVVNNGGTVAPGGTAAGLLTLNSGYVQGPGGTLAVDVRGATVGSGFDQLAVGTTAALDGDLTVATSAFTPTIGQTFRIVDAPAPPAAPTVTGSFDAVETTGAAYDVAVNPTDVTLTAAAPKRCKGLVVTVDLGAGGVPTAGDDVILGTPGADVINGGAGNDTICGGDGDDTIGGGTGRDQAFGQNGKDTIRGGDGADLLEGSIGADRLYGGNGTDTLRGHGQNDRLEGGVGNDRLEGGPQTDTCLGQTGTDSQSGCEVRSGIP